MKCNPVKCLLETKTQNGVANEEISPFSGSGKRTNQHAKAIEGIHGEFNHEAKRFDKSERRD